MEAVKLEWPLAAVAVAVCVAVLGATYITGSAYCLWGLVIVPMLFYRPW